MLIMELILLAVVLMDYFLMYIILLLPRLLLGTRIKLLLCSRIVTIQLVLPHPRVIQILHSLYLLIALIYGGRGLVQVDRHPLYCGLGKLFIFRILMEYGFIRLLGGHRLGMSPSLLII